MNIRWDIIGYLLIFGAGMKFTMTMFGLIAWDYVVLVLFEKGIDYLGQWAFLLVGWGFALFEVWLGIELIKVGKASK